MRASSDGDELLALLSVRECEVLHLIVQHYSDEEIAHCLVVAVPTVHTHVRSILQKLNVTNRRMAARAYLAAVERSSQLINSADTNYFVAGSSFRTRLEVE